MQRILRGRAQFPTGGKVREPLRRPIRCNSETDSIVWMREEFGAADPYKICRKKKLSSQIPVIWDFLLP